MSRKHVAWLYEQLPELVGRGVLDADSAAALRHHYGPIEKDGGTRIALVIFSAAGATLIGLGIILMLAHNWDQLARATRTALALAPLLVAQVLAGWAMMKRSESLSWREATGAFLVLMIGASIALVGQIYQISGDTPGYLFTWMLLSLPVVYLLGATIPALLYLVLLTVWCGYAQTNPAKAALYWPLAGLLAPYVLTLARSGSAAGRLKLFGWVLCPCLIVATAIMSNNPLARFWVVAQSALIGAMALAGSLWRDKAPTIFGRPAQLIGMAAAVIFSLLLTYEYPWNSYDGFFSWHASEMSAQAVSVFSATAVLLVADVLMLRVCWRRRMMEPMMFGVLPLLAAAGYCSSAAAGPTLGIGLFNFYLLALALGVLALGLRAGRLGQANAGMGILALQVACRFFDSNMGIFVRGIAFMVLGAGFLVANWAMLRRRGGVQ